MSLVGTRVNLTQFCTIQRNSAATDVDGWQDTPDWQDHATNVPCRFWTGSGREAINRDTVVAVDESRLVLPLDTDVTEADRVGDITDRGAVVAAGPTSIRAVIRNKDHIELILVKAS